MPVDRPAKLRYGSDPDGAQVAQLVEHATENRSVGGSIPPLGTITPLSPHLKTSQAIPYSIEINAESLALRPSPVSVRAVA